MIIGICDDNVFFLDELKKLLEKDKRIFRVVTYSEPDKLIYDLKNKNVSMDAVFLDIDYGRESNGIFYGNEIYKIDHSIQIIYMTGYHDVYDQEIFLSDSNLVGYMTKPIDEKLLVKYIDKILKVDKSEKVLTIKKRSKECAIPTEEITYLESENHEIVIHTVKGDYHVYEKLAGILERLPRSFVRCHKSYIINMEKIHHIDRTSVFMDKEVVLPVSRTFREEVRKKYFEFIGSKV